MTVTKSMPTNPITANCKGSSFFINSTVTPSNTLATSSKNSPRFPLEQPPFLLVPVEPNGHPVSLYVITVMTGAPRLMAKGDCQYGLEASVEAGQLKFTVTLPDRAALDRLADSLAGLLAEQSA